MKARLHLLPRRPPRYTLLSANKYLQSALGWEYNIHTYRYKYTRGTVAKEKKYQMSSDKKALLSAPQDGYAETNEDEDSGALGGRYLLSIFSFVNLHALFYLLTPRCSSKHVCIIYHCY